MRTAAPSKRPVWITLAAVLVFHTLLLSVQTTKRIHTDFVRHWLLDMLAPAEKLVDMGVNGVWSVWDGYFGLIGTHRENVQLRSQIDSLRMQLAKENEENLESQRLRKLLGMQNSGIGKTVVARVIGGDPTHSRQTVTIDKGQSQGIQPDTSVITPDGIVGRVIYAANSYAIVQLVVDSQSYVGVMVRSSRVQGIVKGTGTQILELDFIEDDNEIKQGDELLTSGQDRIHPKGLPLGVITSVGPRRGLFKTVTIRPSVDFGRLEEVLCVIEHPPAVADPQELPAAPPVPN